MAAHVRGIFRVFQRLSPLAAAGIPHSQPAVTGRTTSARTMMVGTIVHDHTGGVFLNDGGPAVLDLDASFFFLFL